MRFLLLWFTLFLAACAPPPRPVAPPKPDLTQDPSYGLAVNRLTGLTSAAKELLEGGKSKEAGERIAESQALLKFLLSPPHPTLAAMQAVSDSDRLYCRMFLANGHYGWARLLFQKELTRWKTWRPQTPDSARRLKAAADGIEECDRKLKE